MIYIALYNSPKYEGGLEKVVRMILTHYSEYKKKDIMLICSDASQKELFECCGVKAMNFVVKRHGLWDSLLQYSRLKYSFKIFKFAQKKIKNGDILNIHNGDCISFFPSLFRKRIDADFTLITTLHGSLLKLFIRMIKYLPRKFFFVKIVMFVLMPFFWFIEYISLKNVDCIVTITEKMKNFIKQNYRKDFKSTRIVNGMDQVTSQYIKKNISIGTQNALIIGSMTYLKGLDIAIEAITVFNQNNNKKVKLRIIGFRDFYNYYDKEELPEFIEYVGQIKHEDMEEQYRKSNFLLLPSRSEEFASLVVLEALQWKLPIIVSGECNINEMKGWEGFGYQVNTRNIEDWVGAIEKINNSDSLDKIQNNINDMNFSEYSWKNISKRYEELFDSF